MILYHQKNIFRKVNIEDKDIISVLKKKKRKMIMIIGAKELNSIIKGELKLGLTHDGGSVQKGAL